jgi:NADH-quinone oxidoreductase subunit C
MKGQKRGHLVRLVRHRLGAHMVVAGAANADGDHFIVERKRLLELVMFLRRDPDADLALLLDITAIDHGSAGKRFEVLHHLRSPRLGYRALISTFLDEEDASIPSLTSLYAGADELERELYEMFGVYPEGHPQLRPLLLYSGFVGHPLRRDYRAHKQQPLVPVLDDEAKPIVFEEDG